MENIALQKFKRGQVWWWNSPDTQVINGISFGTRPVLIISNDVFNATSSVVTVAPLTTQDKRPFKTHVEFFDYKGVKSTVMLEQIRTISKDDLTDYMGTLPESKIEEINNAILCALGIETLEEKIINENEVKSEEKRRQRQPAFSPNEETMIKKYLKVHNIAETVRFFKDKVSEMSETCLRQRITKLKKEMSNNEEEDKNEI